MKKIRKKIACLVLGVAVVFSNVYAFAGQVPNNIKAIIHAGGVIDQIEGTNSLEAVKNAFINGYRYIELDFNFTTDGHLVCVHDWEKNYFSKEYNFNGAVTLGEFKNLKVQGAYTPITLDNLKEWLMTKTDTYIITDIKNGDNIAGLKYIKENHPYIMSRIMPQIYGESQYQTVKDMGYNNIIYTLYALTYAEKMDTTAISNFAKSHDIIAITFPKELASKAYIDALKASNKSLFVHTVNDSEEMQKYIKMGINAVYTDVLQ